MYNNIVLCYCVIITVRLCQKILARAGSAKLAFKLWDAVVRTWSVHLTCTTSKYFTNVFKVLSYYYQNYAKFARICHTGIERSCAVIGSPEMTFLTILKVWMDFSSNKKSLYDMTWFWEWYDVFIRLVRNQNSIIVRMNIAIHQKIS